MSEELKTDRAELVGRLNRLAPDIFDMPKTRKAMHDAADMIEADGERLAAAGEQKPVAWLYHKPGGTPLASTGKTDWPHEVSPLYAAPQPAPGWDAAIEAAVSLARRWRDEAAEFSDPKAQLQRNVCQKLSTAVSKLRSSQSTSDAGGGVREVRLLKSIECATRNDFLTEKERLVAIRLLVAEALSNPPAADSNASAEARLREALEICRNYIRSPIRMSRDEDEQARRAKIIAMADSALSPDPHASDCEKQGETEPGEKLTHDEIVEMFGEYMPIEAVTILQSAITPNEARKRLRELVPSDRPADVTVEDLADFIDGLGILMVTPINDDDEAGEVARALLDAFTVGRR